MARVIIRVTPQVGGIGVKYEGAPPRLALQVTRGDGSKKRWGPGEEAGDIPQGIQFTTKDPGGFAELSNRLGRDVFGEYSDINLFDDVLLYGPGVAHAFEGRMVRFPRESESRTITPSAVGYAAHLLDNPSVAEIYADRALSHWLVGQSTQRQIDHRPASGNAYRPAGQSEAAFDSSEAGSILQRLDSLENIDGPTVDRYDLCETWYDAHSIPIGSVYHDVDTYDWNAGNAPTNLGGSWVAQLVLSTDDRHTTAQVLGVREDQTPLGYLAASGAAKFWATMQLMYGAFIGETRGDWQVRWRSPCVYGTHGLTRRGADPGGFYGHDLIANIVSRWAPLLNFTTGPGGSIQDDASFLVPHFAPGFDGSVTPEQAILELNAFFLHSWGVYEGREFFWRPTNVTPRIWNARLDFGASLKLEGPQADDHFNGVVVAFTDTSGNRRSVGPPGSRTDAQSSTLADTDPDNPVNAHGIPFRWQKLELTQTTTLGGAIKAGAAWMQYGQQKNQQGEMVVPVECDTSGGGRLPAWMIRSGDYIRLQDGDHTLRRIIQTTYDHDTLRTTCQLDVPAARLDALLERMGILSMGILG